MRTFEIMFHLLNGRQTFLDGLESLLGVSVPKRLCHCPSPQGPKMLSLFSQWLLLLGFLFCLPLSGFIDTLLNPFQIGSFRCVLSWKSR